MLVDVPAEATEGIARSTEVHPVQVCAKHIEAIRYHCVPAREQFDW